MANYDGSIELRTDVDTSGIRKGLSAIKNESKKTFGNADRAIKENTKAIKEQEKAAAKLEKSSKKLNAELKKTKKNTKEAKNEAKKYGTESEKAADKAAKAFKKANTIIKASTVAMVAATVKVVKDATSAYAEYEQLVGGVNKIFDQANISQIMKDADAAYLELNMSANAYLRTINDVGATFASTMGDQKGYDTARRGLLAISDYSSGTGKNLDELSSKFVMITRSASSYQSIADQFSGILPATSADFLAQAQAAGYLSSEYTKLTEVPIAEYQQAVTQMLEKGVSDLGLAGNTAAEAATTISGAGNAMKAAWDNLLVTIANGKGNLGQAITNFTDSFESLFLNLVPIIETVMDRLAVVVSAVAPKAVAVIVQGLIESLPGLAEVVGAMIRALVVGTVNGIIAAFTGQELEKPQIKQKPIVFEEPEDTGIKETIDQTDKLTESTDKATESVKKLNKSLLSFDELNILQSTVTEESVVPEVEKSDVNAIIDFKDVISELDFDMSDLSESFDNAYSAFDTLLGSAVMSYPVWGRIGKAILDLIFRNNKKTKSLKDEKKALDGDVNALKEFAYGLEYANNPVKIFSDNIGILIQPTEDFAKNAWLLPEPIENTGKAAEGANIHVPVFGDAVEEAGKQAEGANVHIPVFADEVEKAGKKTAEANSVVIPAAEGFKNFGDVFAYDAVILEKQFNPQIEGISDGFVDASVNGLAFSGVLAGAFNVAKWAYDNTLVPVLDGINSKLLDSITNAGNLGNALADAEEGKRTTNSAQSYSPPILPPSNIRPSSYYDNLPQLEDIPVVDKIVYPSPSYDEDKAKGLLPTPLPAPVPKGVTGKKSALEGFSDGLADFGENVSDGLTAFGTWAMVTAANGYREWQEFEDNFKAVAEEMAPATLNGILTLFGGGIGIPVPGLATGAVIPGGRPFYAMLGDQPSGKTNLEAPEDLIRKIVREETQGMTNGIAVDVNFSGTEARLIRYLSPKITVSNKYRGKNIITGEQT